MVPEFYFYLVDEGTQQPVAIFSADDCRMHYEVRAREGQIRARYRVDDLDSGVLLRSGYSAPLPREQVRSVLAEMRRKGVSPIWQNG